MNPAVAKSTRHSKITGDFAEHLVLYWLSKHGFECARIDHVGMDLIARRPRSDEVMGISVKSRSRNPGTEGTYLSIPNENYVKLDAACQTFGCSPYFAIVVDEAGSIDVFIIPGSHFLKICPPGQKVSSWRMTSKSLAYYATDKEIKRFRFSTETLHWW